MLNSFSINPENDYYQQRRCKEDDNEQEPIFFLHGTGGAILLNAKLPADQRAIQIRGLTIV
jgi:hypothetical protein